jgi:hypothetical protein
MNIFQQDEQSTDTLQLRSVVFKRKTALQRAETLDPLECSFSKQCYFSSNIISETNVGPKASYDMQQPPYSPDLNSCDFFRFQN